MLIDNKIFLFVLTFLGSFVGQLIVRIVSLDGSLDKWWLLVPPISVPPLSIIPAYLIYKNKVKRGQGGLPYDYYMFIPALTSIIIGLVVERGFELNNAWGSLIKFLFNFITLSLALYLRDNDICVLGMINKAKEPKPDQLEATLKSKFKTQPQKSAPKKKTRSRRSRRSRSRRSKSRRSKSRSKTRSKTRSKSKSKSRSRSRRRIELFDIDKNDLELNVASILVESFRNRRKGRKSKSRSKPSRRSKPAQPVRPTQPTQPTQPVKPTQPTKSTNSDQVKLPKMKSPSITKVMINGAILAGFIPLLPFITTKIPYLGDFVTTMGGISPYMGILFETIVKMACIMTIYMMINMANGMSINSSCTKIYTSSQLAMVITISMVINLLVETGRVPLIPLA